MRRHALIVAVCCCLPIVPAVASEQKSCEMQLAEVSWSYEQLGKDRAAKELQRDHAEVQVYLLQKQLQQLRAKVDELTKAAAKPAEQGSDAPKDVHP